MTQPESNKVSFFNIIKTLVNYFNLIFLNSLSFTIFSIIKVQFFTFARSHPFLLPFGFWGTVIAKEAVVLFRQNRGKRRSGRFS